MKRISLPYYISRSGAKFEPTASFLENSVVVDTNTETLKNAGIPIAQIDHDTYATTKDEMHCFVIGETGCGKTRRVILPTIRLIAKTGESIVISDPKGELYKNTSDILRKKGYDVKVLNFRKPRCGNRWNPLSIVETLYKSKNIENRDRAIMVLNDVISILSSGIESKDDPYWAYSAANLFRGVALMIIKYGNTGELTFENIALTAKKLHAAYSSRTRIDEEKRAIKDFITSLGNNSDIVQNLSAIIVNADDTRNCVMSIFDSMISMYCNQELLLDLFSKSEIDIASIGKKPTALFFILPDDSDAMYPIATCFVKQVYSTLVNLADEQPNGELPNRVTFLLDEFANFAKIPTMHAMLTAARSRKIRFVLVCQSMDQLIEKYTEAGMEILLSNCRVWLYMSCRNLPFLRRLEELAGNYTSPYTNETCPLVDIGALQHFSIGQVLVLNDRCRPVIGYLEDYSRYDFGAEGNGEISDIPQPHSIKKRSLFSLEDVCKANKKQAEEPTNRFHPSFDPHFTPAQNVPIEEETDPLLRKIDEKIAELENLDKAQECITNISNGIDVVSNKNNLSYLIRHFKLDTSKLVAHFDLSLPTLLKQGVEEKHAFSLVNLALYYIDKHDFEKALSLLLQINKDDFRALKIFWYVILWMDYRDPEGAFVSYICYLNNALEEIKHSEFLPLKNLPNEWIAKIKEVPAYSNFLNTKSVIDWINSLKNDTPPEDEE